MSACRPSPTGPSGRRAAERVRGVLDQHDVGASAARSSATGAGSPVKLTGMTARVRSVSAARDRRRR